MFKIILLISMAAVCVALSKVEIEQIRRELNGELSKLEADSNTKKSVADNKQDELDELLKHFTKDKKSEEKKKAITKKKEVTDKEAQDELFKLLVKDESKDEGKRGSDNAQKIWELLSQKKIQNTQNQNVDFSKKFRAALNQQLTKKSAEKNPKLEELFKPSEEKKRKANSEESILNFLFEAGNDKRSLDRDEPKRKKCKDNRTDCAKWKYLCEVKGYKPHMEKSCPLTCGACKVCKEDKLPSDRCSLAKRFGLCKDERFEERLKEGCYETCGYCRVSSPPACQNDPEGCCWNDGTTFVKDGCAACKDASNVVRLCRWMTDECSNKYAPGKWMKQNCPVTCGFCDPKKECHDFPSYKKKCKEWKDEGKCASDEQVKAICPRTCQTCKERIIHNNWK